MENETVFIINTKTGEMECHTGGGNPHLNEPNWKVVTGHYWTSPFVGLYYGIKRCLSGNLELYMIPVLIILFPFMLLHRIVDFIVFCFNDKGL